MIITILSLVMYTSICADNRYIITLGYRELPRVAEVTLAFVNLHLDRNIIFLRYELTIVYNTCGLLEYLGKVKDKQSLVQSVFRWVTIYVITS